MRSVSTKLAVFLHDVQISKALDEVLRSAGQVDLAVAYWGVKSSASLLSARRRWVNKTRVICDLFSGSCHPAEIEKILESGVQVRTLDGFHAKTWISKDCIVVGSANASENGLGFTGRKPANVEAAVLCYIPEVVQDAARWFELQWLVSKPVDSDMLKDAMRCWRLRLATARRMAVDTLEEALREGRESKEIDQAVVVAYKHSDVPKFVEREFERSFVHTYTNAQLSMYPGYDPFLADSTGWRPRKGMIALEFQSSRMRSKPKFEAILRVRSSRAIIAAEGNKTVSIYPCDPLLDVGGYRVAPRLQEELSRRIYRLVEKNKWWVRGDDPKYHYLYLEMPLRHFWDTSNVR